MKGVQLERKLNAVTEAPFSSRSSLRGCTPTPAAALLFRRRPDNSLPPNASIILSASYIYIYGIPARCRLL